VFQSEEILKSVVLITVTGSKTFGTGFAIRSERGETWIVTCAHVVKDVSEASNIRVRGKPVVEFLARGEPEEVDLAVLKVQGLTIPPLKLGLAGEKDMACSIVGYAELVGKQKRALSLQGKLDNPVVLEASGGPPVTGWKLRIEGETPLKGGYSGSPVICTATGTVVAVATYEEDQGKSGYAISPKHLKDVWPDMPLGLLGFFRDRLTDGSETPEMAYLPGGTFKMGDIQGKGHSGEKPVHEVTLDAFAIGRYPVTVGEFRRFVEATGYQTEAERQDGAYVYDGKKWGQKSDASWRNPYIPQTDNHPVICISWEDAAAYCEWLSEQTGEQYSLPTEAEWEYACRSSSDTAYCFGDDASLLGEYAWYSKNAGNSTHPVGEKKVNHWGLYDMHGNVWEWVRDWYERYSEGPRSNPSGPETGSGRVFRGGSWNVRRRALPFGVSPQRASRRPRRHPGFSPGEACITWRFYSFTLPEYTKDSLLAVRALAAPPAGRADRESLVL
jgi:formylglycine-generating enzyme required for sulfatase activity